jgi:hypothetical protein
MPLWSYHQWFGCSFVTLLVWEWVHYNPQYALKYHCSYGIGEWNHVQREVSHLFPTTHEDKWILSSPKIVFEPWRMLSLWIHAKLVQCVSTMIMHAMIVATQDKAWSYTEWVPRENFIPLAIEAYGCLHLHFDSFLISCVHAYIARN